MESLATIIPVAVLIGGGVYVYKQCVTTTSKKSSSHSGKSSSNPEAAVEFSPDDFMTPKQRKEARQKLERQQEIDKQAEKVKKQKAAEEKRRLAAKAAAKAAKAEEEAAALALTSGKQGKKGANNNGKATTTTATGGKTQSKQQQQQQQPQQIVVDKKLSAAEKKQEQKKRQAEIEKKLLQEIELQAKKNNNLGLVPKNKGNNNNNKGGNTVATPVAAASTTTTTTTTSPATSGKKANATKNKNTPVVVTPPVVLTEDPEWTTVMTKKQRAQKNKASHAAADSDDDFTGEIEVISSFNDDGKDNVEAKVEKVIVMVPVPFEKRLIVIGKGAETIDQIKEKTQCWISVPKEDDRKTDFAKMYNNAPVHIKVEGPKAGAAMAKKIILELIDKGFSTTLTGGLVQSKFDVEVIKRPIILGPQGAHLKKLQEVLNVKIVMPERLSRDTSVTIAGSKADVLRCKKAMQQLITDGYSTVTHPTWVKRSMPFGSSYRRRLIGRAGQVIKQLQANTHCKISFPESEETDLVYIIGDNYNIPLAINQIEKLVEQINYDEEEADLAAMKAFAVGTDDNEIDEDCLQYMYIPDDDEQF